LVPGFGRFFNRINEFVYDKGCAARDAWGATLSPALGEIGDQVAMPIAREIHWVAATTRARNFANLFNAAIAPPNV
jgi:hypothetical protein